MLCHIRDSVTSSARRLAGATLARAPLRVNLHARSRLRGTVISPSTPEFLGGNHPHFVTIEWSDRNAEFPLGAQISSYLNRRARGRRLSERMAGTETSPRRFVHTVVSRGCREQRLINTYLFCEWFDDDAIAWATQGFDAQDAAGWKELGLTPAEAHVAHDQGAGPLELLSAWSAAGIPAAEIADWLGAGLTAAEASQQRARGVTVADAAALRSLRRPQSSRTGT